MHGNTRLSTTRRATARGVLLAFMCVSLLAGGCSKAEKAEQADVTFDTSRLPRVTGAKEIFASAATTIFTSPVSVAQTADTVDKALAAGGWQRYSAPFTATSNDSNRWIMSLKKGQQALNVFISIAPAQGNATSVQYAAVALKTDLPFTKDASNIEYSPDRPLLTLVTAEPVDKTLDFYRKELGERGWSLWSEKLDAKQPAGGPSGHIGERGGSADYVNDKEPAVALILTIQNAEAGKFKVELKEYPVDILASLHRAYINGGTNNAKPVDVSALPRLEGAKVNTERSLANRLNYIVAGPVANTIAATKKLLAADGWQPYVTPLDEPNPLSLSLKKGAQGLSVFFTMPPGPVETSGVDYSPSRLGFALPFPADATEIVFDENRPYLSCITAGTTDATLDFFRKELAASGWSPLSAKDATARWPNAKLDETAANSKLAYYISENLRPIVLSVQRRDDNKTVAEIKIPPFALPQALEAGEDIFGMPKPKLTPRAGGTGGSAQHELHAYVPAEVSTVLAFYRREFTARNWKEETQGAVVNPNDVTLTFSPPEGGTAVLKLGHKYDLTTVRLVQQLPKAAAKAEPAPNDPADAIMKQAQEMVRAATADALAATKPPKAAPSTNQPAETLRPLAGNVAPVPVPETAEDVDFASGRLEFSIAASIKSVAEFYRATMRQQGWQAQSSVINNANMVELNFSKAGKSVSFTVMRMGDKTNVTADGSALDVATSKPVEPAAAAPVQASAEDLEAEQSGDLPVPKRHTMTVGTKTPFRRELNANVPLDLATVLGFYRRELGKLNWKEDSKGSVAAPDNVVLAFSSAEGPALLKLGRKDGETTVSLTVRNPDAAAKAGVAPKPGQAKLLISNPNEVEAVITINKQTIKAAAGAGMKGPDGPILDLAPGKYKFSIKLAGKPASNDELEVGADETWGLFVGPAGALPMHVY
ncbi:MAG: hypothetical protein ACXWJ8_01890 [Xanthobacteraceae bacterium]